MRGIDFNVFRARLSHVVKSSGMTGVAIEENTLMARQYLSAWMDGRKEPGVIDYLFRNCLFFGVSADYILGLSDDPRINKASGESPLWKTPEAREIAVIVDELPAASRDLLLNVVKLHKDFVDEWESYTVSRNKKVADGLADVLALIQKINSSPSTANEIFASLGISDFGGNVSEDR